MRTLYMNVVSIWETKCRQELIMFQKYHEEKSTLCFTYLFKIQIYNFLYIKHVRTIAVVNYEWSFGTSHIKTFIWLILLWRNTLQQAHGNQHTHTHTHTQTPTFWMQCSLVWRRSHPTLIQGTDALYWPRLCTDPGPGMGLLFHASLSPLWPALCVNRWSNTEGLDWSCWLSRDGVRSPGTF